jgi:hypothetical protein
MSEIMLTIKDSQSAIHRPVHISLADGLVAALADDPENLEEFRIAAGLYFAPGASEKLFLSFYQGTGERPWDIGIMIVDLPARVIAFEAEGYVPRRQGSIRYEGEERHADFELSYQLSEDWLVAEGLESGLTEARKREAEWRVLQSWDVRAVLYQCVAEFLVRECRKAKSAGMADPTSVIHASWLMTPRDDLRGHTPRELLLRNKDNIELGCESRSHLWSFTGERPNGLSRSTRAYRLGLFGVHENVLYYDLVRHLLAEYWQMLSEGKTGILEEDVAALNRLKEIWLHAPSEEYQKMAPATIIDWERQRIPIAFEARWAMVDPDCPVCQQLENESGPMFWHLDGSGMEDDFPFSFYRTRDEWEKHEREMEEFLREFNSRQLDEEENPQLN